MAGLIESFEKAITKLYRKRISRQLYERSSKAVEYGPFKGMKLIEFSHISSSPLALKIFGLYETEVVEFLTALKNRQTLINLGAGDGYYSIGLIMSGTVKRAMSFELDEKGRKAIAQNAAQNGFSAGVEIFGAADASLPATLKEQGVDPSTAIVLCDIEGAEFSVINRELIAALSGAVYVVEIHDFNFPDGAQKLETLKRDLAGTHDVEIVKARPPAWSGIAELEALPDNARALVTSDGRKLLGRWLFATPKSN